MDKKKLFKISSIYFGILIFIIFAEISIRFYYFIKMSRSYLIISNNPELIFEHRPSFKFTNNGITIRFNSVGFIGNEIEQKKGLRIIGIGDSITEGIYLPESQRYLNIIGKILREKTDRDIEIINSAVGSYNSWQELAMIKERSLNLKPDLIIIGVCLNDYVKRNPFEYKNLLGRVSINLRRDGSKARYFNFLYQVSDLYEFIYERLAQKKRESKYKNYEEYLRNYYFDISQDDWQEWRKPIEEISELGKRNGVKVLFAIFPLHNQLVKDEKFSYKPLTDFLRSRGEYFIDLIDTYSIHYKNGESLYKEFDISHPNSKGHKLSAEAILRYIIDNKILDS